MSRLALVGWVSSAPITASATRAAGIPPPVAILTKKADALSGPGRPGRRALLAPIPPRHYPQPRRRTRRAPPYPLAPGGRVRPRPGPAGGGPVHLGRQRCRQQLDDGRQLVR